ncbi:MAG: hypothetical protein Q4B10_05600 [Actinomycetaceae bacterium]|nr:hypothetical protein [Actinomycetaceae bacterium]
MTPTNRRHVPLTEGERERWIYEDMLSSVREGVPFTSPEEAYGSVPDYSEPTYVPPEAMIPTTEATYADDERSFPEPERLVYDLDELGAYDEADEEDADTLDIGVSDPERGIIADDYYSPAEPYDDYELVYPDEDEATLPEAISRTPAFYEETEGPLAEGDDETLTGRLSRDDTDQSRRRLPSRKDHNRVKKPSLFRRIVRMWPLVVIAAVVVAVGIAAMAVWDLYRGSHPAGVSSRISITEDTTTVPVVSLEAPLPLTFAKTTVVTEGEGDPLREGDPVLVRLTVFDGQTGKLLSSGDAPHYLAGRVDEETLTPDVVRAVVGQRVGSRLALRRPVARGASQAMEIDVIDVLPTRAVGKPTEPEEGAPATIAPSDPPALESTLDEPPSSAYIKVLRAGEGAQVRDGQSVVANFIAWKWHGHDEMTNTWTGKGPQVIDLARAMPGLREQLSDQRVGSRVLIVVPPEQAKGDDTLIVVVDILAVLETTATKGSQES